MKKKWWFAACLLGAVLCLAGCKGNEQETLSAEAAQEQLVPAVQEVFFGAVLPGEEQPDFLTELEALMQIETKEVLESEDGFATVLLSVSAPDLSWVLDQVGDGEGMDEVAMDRAFAEAIGKAPLRTKEVEASFYQEEGIWKPVMTDELFDACYGGILTLKEGGAGNE